LNPLDGEYDIQLQGTGSGGKYGVLTSFVSDTVSTTTQTIGTTEAQQLTNLTINFNNTNPTDIKPEKQVTQEVLINDINNAYELGWIKDIKTRDYLLKKASDIFKNGRIDKRLAKALLTDLKSFSKDKVTIEAYNLLK